MDSYDNFDLIGDENLMQDAFKFGDLDADPGCCFSTRDGDWDPFSASGCCTHTSITNDASIWSEELLNSIVGAEMVLGSDITNQLDERETQTGPSEDNSGNFKSVTVIEGDEHSILSKGESQAEIIMCNSENPGVGMVIGGESNAQSHEVAREMGPIEFNSENLGGEMLTKEEFVIEASAVEADSGCTLHDPGPLGDSSPETVSVIDKTAGFGLMEMSNETEEAEKIITEEKPIECHSNILRCEVVIGCSNNTLDERNFHVGPTRSNSLNLGGETVIEGGRNNTMGEGECYVGRTGKTFKSQIVTEGGRNDQSNERESHVGAIVVVSENLLDETLARRGIDDQPRLGNRQVGPGSPSCENLFGDAKAVTTGDINNKWDEGDCQAGPTKLLCNSENRSNELNECFGSHLIQESTYDVHEIPQGERNTQDKETTTVVSHSEKCFEQIGPSELCKSVEEKNCTGFQLELPFMETGGKEERMKSELCGRELSISPGFSLPETFAVKVDSKCALLDTGLLSSRLPATYLTNDKPVCAPTISTHSHDKKLGAPLCVATAPFPDSSSIAANMGGHLMENTTKIKEAEKRTTEEYSSADCGAHTPAELTTGGCSSPIELTEEPTFEAASIEKHDENEEALNESVLIHSNCKVENTAPCKNLDSNLGQGIHRDGTSRFLATDLACENPAVVEAVPESPAGMGNTEGLHDPSDDATTTVKSDCMEQGTEDIVLEPSPVKLQSEPHGDASSDGSTQKIDNDRISLGCMPKKDDKETNDKDVSGKAEMLNGIIKDVRLTLSPVKISSEHHADASTNYSTLVQSDAVEQDADDSAISVNPLMEKITEKDNAVNDPTELEPSVTVHDVGPRLSAVENSFGFNRDTSSIDSAPIQLENKMEDGKFSGNILSKKSTEENYKNIPTMEDVEPSFSPVKITPGFDMDASPIDHVLVTPEDEIKNVKVSDGCLDKNRSEDKSSKVSEITNDSRIEDLLKISCKTNDEITPVNFVPIQSDHMIGDGKGSGDLGVVQSSCLEREYSGAMNQRSEATIGSLVEGMRSECESTPVDKQGGVHVGAISIDCVPIQSDISASLSHIEGEDLKATNQTDIISIGEEMETRSKSTSQEMAELVEGMRPQCESTPVDKGGGTHVGAILNDFVPIQSDIAVSQSHIEGEDIEAINQTDTTVISIGKSTSQEMAKLVEGKRPECESTPVKKQGGAHVGAILTNCVLIQSDIAVSLSHIEGEDLEATNQTDTTVISIGEEMETQSKSTSQEMSTLVEAENKTVEVIGALFEIAEASSAHKLSQNSETGDDASDPQLDDVLLCTLTESKDPKPGLLEFGNGEKTCSSSECSLPEENVTGVSLGDSSQNVKLGTMKEPQVKFIVPEKSAREDMNNFESPSACASGTVVDEKTENLKKRYGVSGSNIHSPSTSEAVMLNEAVNNRTCVDKNAKLPDLNMPQPATSPSHESVTEAQKMQLRAQICIYGRLVDGSLPIEAYMERSFGESERCIWEPIWHAYSETLKNRSPLSSGKTPTLSGSQLRETATRTIQNDTSFISPFLDSSPAFSANVQSSSWHLSPQSRARKEPLQPIRVRLESEKPSRKKRSFADEVCSPGQNYVVRNANLITAATNKVTSDFNGQTLPVPVSPVLPYATHSKKEKAGLVPSTSCTHGFIVQPRLTSENLTNKVVPGCSLEKEPNIEPICSLDRDRSVFSCAALPVFQLQSSSGYYQIAPPAPSCVLVDQSSQQAKELSARASEILDRIPGLQETVTTDQSSSTDPQDEVTTAVAAAESVTKAAAAARLASEAARLASEAALQAQLLADEATRLMDPNPGIDLRMFQAGMELEMVTPTKVLKSKDKVHGSDAIVSAMREASRRRVKLASAASKRAENMDTILRAAEMAAEAVSQVGRVLMMGDPLPLSIADMVEAIGGAHLRAVQSGDTFVSRREKVVDTGLATHDGTIVTQADEALMMDAVPLSFGQRELTEPGENISVEIGGYVIKKGSHIEVTGEKEGLIGVWFGAIVLDLKDGMAHIRYTDLPSCKEEWVPVERESGASPVVRLAHPVTALKYDGNRKRRRENVSSYSWSVGDHVDAWMRDGWRECIIAQKHDDEAKYTVHFPVQGESLVVGEWDLRPSLVWKKGSWVERVRVKESSKFCKGDSPLEKRQRVCSPPHDAEIVMSKPNPSKSTKIPKPLHSTSLSIGANRKKEESVSEPKRTGPRVCFGIPHPNKKTKFLEVAQVSRPRLANDSNLVPNSNGRERWQKPLTKIPEPSKEPLLSSRFKGLEGNLNKVRGKKPMTEPVTRKRVLLSSTMLGGQNGTSHRKGVLNVGTGTSDRAGKTKVAAASIEPRRSGRKVKPTSRVLEGLATDGLMSKIPGMGSTKGPVSLKGPT